MMELRTENIFRTAIWLVLGCLIGIGIGLLLGWVAWPPEFTEANPTVLDGQYKRDYALMIASTYWEDQDLNSARNRLSNLGEVDALGWYRDVTLDFILDEEDEEDIRHLVNLAADLGIYSQVMEPFWPGAPEE